MPLSLCRCQLQLTNEASKCRLLLFEEELWGGGPEEWFLLPIWLAFIFLRLFIPCRLLGVRCRVLVLIVGCILGGVFSCWLSGVAWLLSADCRLSGVAVSGSCWFLVVGYWLSGVGCGSFFPFNISEIVRTFV